MKNIKVKDFIEKCDGELIFGDESIECVNFSKDTRTINQGDIYLGIKGDNFNGSLFYEAALEKGAKVCIIQDVDIPKNLNERYNDRTIIKVKDVIKALQEIAKYKRSLYDIPVVAITGSVGKTSTKDIVGSVLSMKYKVLKTEGNLNNHIGLPLTILNLQNHEAMVLEMGMNNLGEISLLTSIAKPTVVIITNIGTAHIGNLGSRENILKAKLEIIEGLNSNGAVIINNDSDLLNEWNKEDNKYKVITFGIKNSSNLTAYDIELKQTGSVYKVNFKGVAETIEVPIGGLPFVYNSLCALCIGELFAISPLKVVEGIKKFELSKNRMEVEIINGITIINDCYNANFDSMKAGIEYLSSLTGNRKIAVLGDMLELGEYSMELHKKLGEEIKKNNINVLMVVGEAAKYIAIQAEVAGMDKSNIFVFDNNFEAISKINSIKSVGDCILVKASNGMKFKEIINAITKCEV